MSTSYSKRKPSLARLTPKDKAHYALLRSALENLATVDYDGCCFDSLFELRLSSLICTVKDCNDWDDDEDNVIFQFSHNYWIKNSLNRDDDIPPWRITEEGNKY